MKGARKSKMLRKVPKRSVLYDRVSYFKNLSWKSYYIDRDGTPKCPIFENICSVFTFHHMFRNTQDILIIFKRNVAIIHFYWEVQEAGLSATFVSKVIKILTFQINFTITPNTIEWPVLEHRKDDHVMLVYGHLIMRHLITRALLNHSL